MKRKRGYAKRKLKKPSVEEAVQDDAALVADYELDDLPSEDNAMHDEAPEFETNNGPILGKQVDAEGMEDNANTFCNRNKSVLGNFSKLAGTIATKLRDSDNHDKFKSGMEIETRRADTSTSAWQADLGNGAAGKIESFSNSLRDMIVSIISDISKESAGGPPYTSRTLGDNPTSNASMPVPQIGRTREEKDSILRKDPRYNEQELCAALSVIRKIMKMDVAAPFNVPVDPIALGIPDYFDVIDTPMDFGTICNNLENGIKYMDSGDVFKDVQIIWENCCKYNKKGDYVLEIMRRARKSFMKYWVAAGLRRDQLQAIDESNLTVSKVRKESSMGPNQSQNHQQSLMHSQAYDPQKNSNESQPSPEQDDVSNSTTAHPKFITRDCALSPVTPVPLHQSNSVSSYLHDNQASLIEVQALQHQLSSNQQQQGDANIDSTNMQKKRVRGPTRCLKLLNEVGRIVIATNDLGQPIGVETPKLTSFLGLVARDGNLAPLTYPSWGKMPFENKENMWQKVLTKFDIGYNSKSWVIMSLGTKWRNFKSHLKINHYDTHATDAERLADRDERVLPDQWSALVSQWSSEKWQNISAINKANRSRMKFCHTAGKKSFARLREEEKAKRLDGKEPSRAELFILTRTRKDGKPVNEATAAVISQLRECTSQEKEILKENSNPQDDAYTKVMGPDRKGGVCLYGLGTSNPSRSDALRMASEAKSEVYEMKEKLESMEKTCTQMASQMATLISMVASMQKNSPNDQVSNAEIGTFNPAASLPMLPENSSKSHQAGPSRQTRSRNRR